MSTELDITRRRDELARGMNKYLTYQYLTAEDRLVIDRSIELEASK